MKKISISSSTIFLSLSILSFVMLLQLENIATHYVFHASEISLFEELLLFLGNQFETIIFFLLLFLLFSIILVSSRTRWIAFPISALALIYLIVDQLFFKYYLDHFRYGFDLEGQSFDFALLLDSLLSIIDYTFCLNLAIALALSVYNFKHIFNPIPKKYTITVFSGSFFTYLFISVTYLGITWAVKDFSRKEFQNAFFVLLKSLYQQPFSNQPNPSQVNVNSENLYTPRYASPFNEDQEVLHYLNNKKNSTKKYNIVYIILESVGTINLFNETTIDSSIATNLYSMRNKSIVFPNLHCLFPSTTRSHIPIISGGNALTYGSISEIRKKYKGPTLISELKKMNYRTGLFTAQFMNFEELDNYYHLQDLDKEFMPETMSKKYTTYTKLNSWGIDEKEPMNELIQWIDPRNTTPFFAEFMNTGTHHPYSVPKGYATPFDTKTDSSKYKNAIHYADFLIGQLVDSLKKKGLYESTLIVISGDHGEAFGDRHYGNFLHKNFLYEENIRNFLLLLDPDLSKGPLISNKQGFIGDIAPTILSYTTSPPNNIFPGQNLLSETYKSKIHYFSKNSYPELWGLVDGDWKFIVEKIGNKSPELYNLKNDPLEKKNLATRYPKQVEAYQSLLPHWYVRKNKEYTKYLEGYPTIEEDELKATDVQKPGPKNLIFGNMIDGNFTKKQTVHPKENIYAWTRVVPFPENIHLRYRWISPSGKSTENDFYFDKEWATAWKSFERTSDMEEGNWECQVLKGNEVLIKNSFYVSSKVSISEEYYYTKGPVKLYLGIKDENGFINLEEMHPDETVMAFSQINPYTENKILLYDWISPKDKKYRYQVPCEAGWNYTWLSLNEREPMEEGKWDIRIYEGRKKLLESSFIITQEAKLYQSYKTEQRTK